MVLWALEFEESKLAYFQKWGRQWWKKCFVIFKKGPLKLIINPSRTSVFKQKKTKKSACHLECKQGFLVEIAEKKSFSATMNDKWFISTYLHVDASCQVMRMINVDRDRLATTSCLIAWWKGCKKGKNAFFYVKVETT